MLLHAAVNFAAKVARILGQCVVVHLNRALPLVLLLAHGNQVHSFIDANDRCRIASDVVKEKVSKFFVDFCVCLPVACVAIFTDIVKLFEIVNRIKVHPKSVLRSSTRNVLFQFFQLLCGYLIVGGKERERGERSVSIV